MGSNSKPQEGDVHIRDGGFLYSVLNIHNAASQNEINERHRALSLIFHPDKQRDESSKVTATARFLEIQKAYQILSDPFLRDVYDLLGEEGLSIKWPAELRTKPREEVEHILKLSISDLHRKKRENDFSTRGRVTCTIDASSMFAPYVGPPNDPVLNRILNRWKDVRLLNCNLQHTVEKRISSKTQISFSPRVARQGQAGGCNFLGTVRHQFSPHLVFEGAYALLHPRILNLNANYQDDNNSLSVRTSCIPSALGLAPPSLNVSVNRKLFPRRFEQGSLTFAIGRQPHVSFNIISPTPFSFHTPPPADDVDHPNAPSISGLKVGATHKSAGFMLDFKDPKVVGEWGVTFSELALQMKVGLELGLTGLSWVFSGSWASESTELSASTFINSLGVVLKLEASYLEQKLSLPIVLSQGYDSAIAFWTVVAPSTTLVLGYHFIIKPKRRAQRLSFIRSARQALDEDSGERREREAVAALLKETARKHMEAETSKGGLVILEATFGSIEADEGTKDLAVDVTIPIQALVRHSQLYIAGHQTKSGIQGFSDPAPFTTKSLNIRYLFRGRVHYAEIPDYLPVVLPLAEHLVE